MSITREEAIKILQHLAEIISSGDYQETFKMAVSALRPISREQVEKVWRGEWKHTHSINSLWTEVWVCSRCGLEDDNGDCFDFCPSCGAPMTDEAVKMVMDRLEAPKDED